MQQANTDPMTVKPTQWEAVITIDSAKQHTMYDVRGSEKTIESSIRAPSQGQTTKPSPSLKPRLLGAE